MTEKETKQTEDAVSQIVAGLTPVDPATLEEFLKKMNEEVIPKIVEVVEERRILAAESRERHLKL